MCFLLPPPSPIPLLSCFSLIPDLLDSKLTHVIVFYSEFGFAFIEAQAKCNAQVRYTAFDTSVIEIHKDDLVDFLNTLCEGAR